MDVKDVCSLIFGGSGLDAIEPLCPVALPCAEVLKIDVTGRQAVVH